MGKSEFRSMRSDDWTRVPVERGRYFNQERITGYERVDGQNGNPLHPVCVFEDKLRETHQRFRETYSGVSIARRHVRMPYWDRADPSLPDN